MDVLLICVEHFAVLVGTDFLGRDFDVGRIESSAKNSRTLGGLE